MKAGQYDTLKGSFYVNCQSFYLQTDPSSVSDTRSHYHTAPNLWPSKCLLPGFREIFEELCTLVIDIGALVARACDQYATKYVEGYDPGYLERMVKTSSTTKARLLHYFPPPAALSSASASPMSTTNSSSDAAQSEGDDDMDSWCATHLDDGCLTALTSALHIDESSSFPPITSALFPSLPTLVTSPDPSAGLYIRSRTSNVVKVDIPSDCLAFQTGEALQLITGGAFKAVPHFVRGPKVWAGQDRSINVARNTMAIFMQPNVNDVIERSSGMTFGEFANISVEKHS